MMNFGVSSKSYAQEIKDVNDLRLNISLFDYEKHTMNGLAFYCLDKPNFQKALQVHATYQDLGILVLQQKEQRIKLERKYTSCDFELRACKTVLHDIDLDRKNLYALYEDTISIGEIELRKQKIKFIIVGVAGGVLAVAGGFLVGYFVGK